VETFDSPDGFYGRFLSEVVNIAPDPSTWQGDHDGHCGAPTTTRTIHASAPTEAIYYCAPAGPATGHIMTSMDTVAYGEVSFSPNQVFTGLDRVCWDQNRTDLGSRKWTQMTVVPEATFQANGGRLDYGNPMFADGPTKDRLRVTGETFMLELLRTATITFRDENVIDSDYSIFTTSDKARRFRTCVTDQENGTVRIELELESTTAVRVQQGAFPNGPARVIFQDASYDPPKDVPATPDPFTWHWDNIVISS